MKGKIDFYSSLLFTAVCCLLLLDTVLWMAGLVHQIPTAHKEFLLMGFLLWFAWVMVRRGDDDLAGQF